MRENLTDFVAELKKALGENLRSVILYGSALHADFDPSSSNVNVLAVLETLGGRELAAIAPLARGAQKKSRIHCVFWSERELLHSQDVFSLEFSEIALQREVLLGKDYFADFVLNKENLRCQLEFEWRSKLALLRSTWFWAENSPEELARLLAASGGSFKYLFGAAQKIFSEKLDSAWSVAFEDCAALKHPQRRLDLTELRILFQRAHSAACAVIEKIDGYQE